MVPDSMALLQPKWAADILFCRRLREGIEAMKSVLFKYIYQCRRCILGLFICLGIYACIFALFRVPAGMIWYPVLLCLFVGCIMFIWGLASSVKRHKELLRINDHISLQWNNLPAPGGILEADYQLLLASLGSIRDEEFGKWQGRQLETADYYATWVHQIKAPIAVMRVILQSEDTPVNQELLSELFRVEQYVEMVLCYVRLGDQASDLVIENYELDKIIRRAIRKYAGQFIRSHIKLIYRGTSQVVLTDEKWLLFIIEQLLSNAIKYTEKGTVTISVNERKQLMVEDTGIGIAPEDLPRIFEKGFTGYNGRSDKKSTGIGLYLCKSAARKLGHRLTVSSCIGTGSRFILDLNSYPLETE